MDGRATDQSEKPVGRSTLEKMKGLVLAVLVCIAHGVVRWLFQEVERQPIWVWSKCQASLGVK